MEYCGAVQYSTVEWGFGHYIERETSFAIDNGGRARRPHGSDSCFSTGHGRHEDLHADALRRGWSPMGCGRLPTDSVMAIQVSRCREGPFTFGDCFDLMTNIAVEHEGKIGSTCSARLRIGHTDRCKCAH